MVLTDRGLATEIAQISLGDLTFNVHTLLCTYSSTLDQVLWDIEKAVLTSVTVRYLDYGCVYLIIGIWLPQF